MENARLALTKLRENESWFSLTRYAQDLLDEFETIDEHGFRNERFEIGGEYFRGARRPQHFRRLRPYLVRLRDDLIASDSEEAPKQVEAIKRWLTQIERLKKVGRRQS